MSNLPEFTSAVGYEHRSVCLQSPDSFPCTHNQFRSAEDLGGGEVRSETRPQVPLSQLHNGSTKATSRALPHQAVRSQIGVHKGPPVEPLTALQRGKLGYRPHLNFLRVLSAIRQLGAYRK